MKEPSWFEFRMRNYENWKNIGRNRKTDPFGKIDCTSGWREDTWQAKGWWTCLAAVHPQVRSMNWPRLIVPHFVTTKFKEKLPASRFKRTLWELNAQIRGCHVSSLESASPFGRVYSCGLHVWRLSGRVYSSVSLTLFDLRLTVFRFNDTNPNFTWIFRKAST